jgi:hypothetical protein
MLGEIFTSPKEGRKFIQIDVCNFKVQPMLTLNSSGSSLWGYLKMQVCSAPIENGRDASSLHLHPRKFDRT